MTVRLEKLTADNLAFPGMEPYNEFTGAAHATVDVPVETAKKAIGYIVLYQAKGLLTLVAAVLTAWESEALCLAAPGSPLADPNNTSLFVLKQPPDPAAGEIATMKVYPTGAAAGTPAKLSTFAYGDALYPKTVTSIIETDTTV